MHRRPEALDDFMDQRVVVLKRWSLAEAKNACHRQLV
jgi:hypothetical protein